MRHTKKRMSKSTLLLTLACILCAVILTITILSRVLAPDGTPQSGTPDESTVLAAAEADSITALAVTTGEITTTYQKTADKWVLADKTDYPLDAKKMEALVTAAANLTASGKVLESLSDAQLQTYGLDKPYTVKVTAGETSYTLAIGNKYSYGNSYYVRLAGDDALYRMDGAAVLTLQSSLATLTYGAELPEIKQAHLKRAELVWGLAGGSTAGMPSATYTLENDATILSRLLTAAAGIDTKLYADWSATAEELAAYGLTGSEARTMILHAEYKAYIEVYDPTFQQMVTTPYDKKESFTYTIGKTTTVTINGTERQMAYVTLSGEKYAGYVYYMDVTALAALSAPTV